jgi:uncharacterized membrane protein YhaH (DUF805 family)
MDWYLKVLKNYVGFSGRARRKEYWMFVLFNILFAVAAMVLDNVLGLASEKLHYGPIYGLYALAVFLPGLAAGVRRLHDTDRSGWWLLLCLVPLVGLVVIVFLALEGTPGGNRFGPDPKAGEGNMAATVA